MVVNAVKHRLSEKIVLDYIFTAAEEGVQFLTPMVATSNNSMYQFNRSFFHSSTKQRKTKADSLDSSSIPTWRGLLQLGRFVAHKFSLANYLVSAV